MTCKMEWIDVKERLPSPKEWVLIYVDDKFSNKKFHVGYLAHADSYGHMGFEVSAEGLDNECSLEYQLCSVLGWMPIPDTPK